jgi:hypothetical protein
VVIVFGGEDGEMDPINKVSMQGFEALSYLFWTIGVFGILIASLFLYGVYIKFKGK